MRSGAMSGCSIRRAIAGGVVGGFALLWSVPSLRGLALQRRARRAAATTAGPVRSSDEPAGGSLGLLAGAALGLLAGYGLFTATDAGTELRLGILRLVDRGFALASGYGVLAGIALGLALIAGFHAGF